jgi:high-affinity Fe2+/Pb2+ permease
MAFQDYFSVVAFFIFLRETLEASVIIAVLLQCMNRTCPRLKKQGARGGCVLWWAGCVLGVCQRVLRRQHLSVVVCVRVCVGAAQQRPTAARRGNSTASSVRQLPRHLLWRCAHTARAHGRHTRVPPTSHTPHGHTRPVTTARAAAVWWGAAAGIAGSIVVGGIFAAVYYVAQAHAFQVWCA